MDFIVKIRLSRVKLLAWKILINFKDLKSGSINKKEK